MQVENVFTTAIRVQPVNPVVTAFDNVTLTCTTTSVAPSGDIKYSWHRVGGDIHKKANRKNATTLIIPTVVPEDEGEYYCMAEQHGHCAESTKIILRVDGKKIVQFISHRLSYYYAAVSLWYACMYVCSLGLIWYRSH